MKKLVLLLLLLGASVSAQDKKISDLTSGSPAQASDMIPIARAGANFRLAGSDFLSSAGGTFTNQLLGPASATTPSFSFTGDTSTGISRPFAGMVGLLAGGLTSIYASSAGGFSNFTFTIGTVTTDDRIKILPVAMGSGTFDGSITSADLTAARTWTFPNATGVVTVFDGSGNLDLGGTKTAFGSLSVISAQTGTASTTAVQSGYVITNTGDADGSTNNLLNDPTAGVNYSFAVTVAQTMTIAPATGETLYLNAASCANITSATIGAVLSIVASVGGSGGKWFASGTTGWACN